MNYAEMTDFEINKAVAGCHLAEWYDNGICVVRCDDDSRSIFNPCNSWADAGPIIEANQISLNSTYEGGPCWLSVAGDDGEFGHTDTKPLRAAMIVFLMMQERANA